MENNQPPIPETNDLPPVVPGQETQAPEVPVNVPPVENNSPSVPLSPKAKSKLIPALLTILILGLLGVGGIYAYKNFFVKTPEPTPVPTPAATVDPTADWKTYVSNEYGYSIKYPKSWEPAENLNDTQTALNFLQFQEDQEETRQSVQFDLVLLDKAVEGSCGPYTCYPSVQVMVPFTDNSKIKSSLESWLETYIKSKNPYQTINPNTDFQKIIVGGSSAIKFGDSVFFSKNNYIYFIRFEVPNMPHGRGPYDESVFDQILSTFKFTDKTSTTDISNWKTFSDIQYGISFKYPENQYTKDNPPKIDCPTPADNTITRCTLSVVNTCSSFECTDLITIQVYLDPNDTTYKSSLNDFSGSLASSKIVSSNINGIPAKMRTYSDAQKIVIAQMYYVTTSKHSYIIYGKPNDSTFNQIISTLRISQ